MRTQKVMNCYRSTDTDEYFATLAAKNDCYIFLKDRFEKQSFALKNRDLNKVFYSVTDIL